MAKYDTVIKNGLIVDGTRAPRYRGDLAIKDGRVAAIGRVAETDADRVVDATGCIVAPGIVDQHTHYEAQVFWDPHCTISSWHGVTTVVTGNCGFGFAPVAPEQRERAMLTMTRVEAIPLASMQEGMPWDWVTFPEFLDSIDRTPKGVNVMCLMPLGPLLVWVMGLEGAKSGRQPTPEELAQLKELLHEAMDAGACGWSAQRVPPEAGRASHRDFDGTAMPTDYMSDETALALAEVLGERNAGFIEMSMMTGDVKHDASHQEELATASGRPVLYNVIVPQDAYPNRHRGALKWLEKCRDRGIPVYGQAVTTAVHYMMTLEDWNLFDESDAWMEATTGTVAEKMVKLADPDRRQLLKDETKIIEDGVIAGSIENLSIFKVENPELKQYVDKTVGEVAQEWGKHPVDAMLDLAVADNLKTSFYVEPVNNNLDLLSEVVQYPYALWGVSDGGAHTKFLTAGRYPTEMITRFVRDNAIVSLEEAHYRLSALPAHCAGLTDRGTLTPGSAADVIVYDYDELNIEPAEVVHDLPGGEWRRIQRARGFRYILVNGEITFIDGQPTESRPGQLLRNGGTR